MSGTDSPGRQVRLTQIIAVSLLLCLSVVSVLWFLRAPIQAYLHSVTGEEDVWEQVKGFGRWFVLRLTSAPLHLAPETPMSHAGVNPFGINTFLEQEVEPAKVELALSMIQEAGFRWIRQEFPWEDIEQNARGDFWDHKWNVSAWAKYDRIVDLAEKHDVQIIARLDNPPDWTRAEGDVIGTMAPPDDLTDFGNFVRAVVSRYRGRIRYYQIWNEPNIYPEWGERPVDPAGYVALLQVAYQGAKEADPDCVILSAGLAQTTEAGPTNLNDLDYLQQMYDAGVQGYFDIMGVMAYGLWTGPSDHRTHPGLTNFSRDIMVRNGDAEKPLWATEVGWNAVPPDFGSFPMFGRVDLWQQARYAVGAYQRAQEEWPWMGMMNYWFFKRATDAERDQVFYYFRMVEPDFRPMPVYEAMKGYANQEPLVYGGYHQEDQWALQWEGQWDLVRDERAVLGSLRRTGVPGSVLRFAFVGTEVHLVVHKSPEGGEVAVSVDGGTAQEVALQSDVEEHGVLVTVARGLTKGKHQVEVRASGSPGAEVGIDGLLVRTASDVWRRCALAGGALAIALAMSHAIWHSMHRVA